MSDAEKAAFRKNAGHQMTADSCHCRKGRQGERVEMSLIGSTARKKAFTLVELLLVFATIALLAAIAIPNFIRARSTARHDTELDKVRQIDGMKMQWALEHTNELDEFLAQAPWGKIAYQIPKSIQ